MIGYLRHLANFARIVEAGGLTPAAERFDIGLSSLSDSVRQLEAHLGEPLLERRRDGSRPTPRGVDLYPHARDILQSLEAALGQDDAANRREVRISAPVELCHGPLRAGLAAQFRADPATRLTLFAEDALRDHTRYSRDLFVRVQEADSPGLKTLHDRKTRPVLVAAPQTIAPDARTDPAAVGAMRLIRGPPAKSDLSVSVAGFEQSFDSAIAVPDIATRVALAEAGLGATLCLQCGVYDALQSGDLVELFPNRINLTLSVRIATPHRRPWPRLRQIARHLAEALP